jgi:hypothetical protein
MTSLKHIRAIALGLAVTGASALAGTAYADEPCVGVDIDLTDERAQEYTGLIADAIGEGLQPSDVEIYAFLESGNWSAVYGDIPTADTAMFFFEEVDGERQFRDVWGGWADPSERPELIEWAENLGAPENLATCFAHYILDDTAADQSFGFSVELAFSDRALSTLTERGEEIVVSASYYAKPTPEGEEYADDVGSIDLGTEDVQVPAEPGDVEITGSEVDSDSLQWTEGDIMVHVSVFTARLSGPDNLINCDIIQGPLADVTAMPAIMLHCALIEEGMEMEVKP